MSIRKAYLLIILLGITGSLQLKGQNADSLFRKFQAELQIADPQERDSVSIRNYAAYAIYKINDRENNLEALIDSLTTLCKASDWPKAQGILQRVQARFFELDGDMDQGLQYYNSAIEILRESGPDYQDLSTALIGSGFILLNTQLHEQAFKSLKEGYKYAKLADHRKNQILTLNFFGDYYYYSAFRQEKFDSALYYYQLTDQVLEEWGWQGYFKADNYLGLANVYRRLGRLKESESYFKKSLEEAEKWQNYGVIYALYVDKAEVYEDGGNFEEALELKLKAYEYVEAAGWIEFIARADNHLYSTYKSLGKYEEALHYYEKYIAAQDSMKKEEATARFAELEAKYESKEKEEEIYRLQNKNLQQSRDYLMWLAIIGGILIGFISWLNFSLRKKNKELKKKNQEILLAQLRGQNLERKRMAVELHDNLNTKIAAIRWQLEAINPSVDEKAQRILNKTLELVNDVYGDVRLISHNLMPEKVETLGLISALESLLTQLKQNNKVKFQLVVNTGPDFDFGSLTYPIYNIIFEMINNILKHADADHGWISISEEAQHILITVSDDGKGFDIDQMTNGYGIRNITSRLENIEGKWNIESAPGKGTKFFMEIPRID
ncbi:MAG: tetratricopeptide repeat protein [Bacteroidia bacterium]|nr:tetratricopeptide repeat protein [Bacteroidia bacterium]